VKIRERKRDGVALLELSGKIMGGDDALAFDGALRTLIHEGTRNIVVSLEKVTWINSSGLGILISGYSTVRNSGGDLRLLNVSSRIESIFMVSKLHTVFQSFDDEDAAVRSFA
jgi:anti-sigma B factor antagonist